MARLQEFLEEQSDEAEAAFSGQPAPARRQWGPDEMLPVAGQAEPWNPDASPLPTAASRPRPRTRPSSTFTAQELGLEPGTQVSEQDGDAAALRADGFTVLPWGD